VTLNLDFKVMGN